MASIQSTSLLLFGFFILRAVAQTSSISNSSTTVAANSVVSLFVPEVDYSTSLTASVIGSDPSLTTYAILISSLTSTLTEGDSTFIFTSSDSTGGSDATVTCVLDGATSTANIPATSAVCAGTSSISGRAAPRTSTLTGTQISYVAVTLLANAALSTAPASQSTTATVIANAGSAPLRDSTAGLTIAVIVGMLFN